MLKSMILKIVFTLCICLALCSGCQKNTQQPVLRQAKETGSPSSALSSKTVAESFLEQYDDTVKSYDGEKVVTLTEALLQDQPMLRTELKAMNVDMYDHRVEYEGQSLLNRKLVIESFTFSGYWRETYIHQDVTKGAVVVVDHKALGGFTLLDQGETDSEGIWNIQLKPSSDDVVVATNGMTQKEIATQLIKRSVEHWKQFDRLDMRIAKSRNFQVHIRRPMEHGFDFNVTFEVLPFDKEKYALAGDAKMLEDGWVRYGLVGVVIQANANTYILLGAGTGP